MSGDPNLDPVIDLSIDTLRRACRGDPARLPSFIVHDDAAWPWHAKVRPAKGKVHIRRSTFNRVVAGQVPLRPGLWVRDDAQEFHIDLKVHDLQGTTDEAMRDAKANPLGAARAVSAADSAGRLPDEEDYGAEIVERSESRQVERADLERVAADPERGGVRSSLLSRGDTERALAVGNDD